MSHHRTQLISHIPAGIIFASLDDGVHAGKAIVSGPSWSDPVTSPGWCILDIVAEPEDVRRAVCRSLLSASDISKVSDYFAVDSSLLPPGVRAALLESGRAPVTVNDILQAVGFAPEWTASMVQLVEEEQGTWVD